MREAGPQTEGAVGQREVHVQHLGGEVSIGEPTPARATAPTDIDPHPHLLHVRLELDGPLDRPGKAPGRSRGHGDPQVLVEDAAELDAGLEGERFPTGDPRGVDRGSRHRR